MRPPLSLQKLLVDEGRDAVVYRAPCSDYFRTDSKIFPPTAFLAEVLPHLPDARKRLIRCYGLYSLRARGTWSRTPHLCAYHHITVVGKEDQPHEHMYAVTGSLCESRDKFDYFATLDFEKLAGFV